MLSFSDKIFLSLLAAIPLLTAIYFLFRRSRPLVVSALMLWAEQRQSRRSGMTLKKMPLPLTYFIELLILSAIALAAASPLLLRKNDASPLTLVLDNSFSMRAGRTQTVQQTSRREIDKLIDGMSGRKFRIILAGTEPRNLGEFTTAADINNALAQWSCDECGDTLTSAVAMARRLDLEKSSIVVFTDHLPADTAMPANLTWNARGVPLDNIAIVNASRSSVADKDRAMVMIANIGGQPCRAVLTVSFPGTSRPALTSELALAADQLKKVSIDLPAACGPVAFTLSDDILNFDNRIILLPESRPPLRTSLQITDQRVAADVRRALESSGKILFTGESPTLTVTDRLNPKKITGYRLFIQTAKQGKSVAGPFTVSRNHPLCDGLDLNGVIWGFPPGCEMPGVPLISVGETTLLSFESGGDSAGDLYLAWNPSASTIQNTPAWPVLFWNLAEWLENSRPGPLRSNFRAAEKIVVNQSGNDDAAELKYEDGRIAELPVSSGSRLLNINAPGTFQLRQGAKTYDFRINPLNYRESDLSRSASGSYEGERTVAATLQNYRDVAWVPLLAAILLLTLHQFIIGRRPKNDLQ